jgi:hypothetical protein
MSVCLMYARMQLEREALMEELPSVRNMKGDGARRSRQDYLV